MTTTERLEGNVGVRVCKGNEVMLFLNRVSFFFFFESFDNFCSACLFNF